MLGIKAYTGAGDKVFATVGELRRTGATGDSAGAAVGYTVGSDNCALVGSDVGKTEVTGGLHA